MRVILPVLAGAIAFTDVVSAHYRWTSLIVNGAATSPYQYVRQNTNANSPVTSVSSNDIRCNAGGLASGASTGTASVAAGATVGFALDQAIFHPGPITVYLSKAPSTAASYDGSGAWFKIAEVGATISTSAITWPASDISQYTFKIPSSTPAGEYLLRIEHIALHSASTTDGAQFYISCAQLKISGSGSGSPGPTIKLPGGYSATDPGILIGIYWPIPTSYKIPGPAVWSG
ncbi:hypothetical protein V499_08187 [Pseudogymnoascus sp. VKM F-103]|uniref:AA9 family lytic polysaccharide monooxygenase n=1 Tax=Pseudogymnoascus verrucosus TaxID=342668 RepID=A0A1B8GJH6_9PEZI|nr:uncharacterized protein VE01_06716 [Pseudogymnoascus verrucosus]KFY71598.1 hypothetical protein V499_08187 [Pseudogymnoascus sp. VKM F-103]OBT95991.1 hypothetical protein VE01_06716 [Pseudogymnoascus verrucosus]